MSESQTGSIWGWRGEISGMGQRIKRVFETGERVDIQFEVGHQYGKEELFQAHKFALSISSEVFDTMFYGSIPQTEKTIKLPDILPQAFRIMLKYLYTDVVEDLNLETALPTLYCAQKYGIPLLVDICAEYATKNVGKCTCLAVLKEAEAMDVGKVVRNCLRVVDLHCSEVLQSEQFLQLKQETLQLIFKRDTLRISEGKVYKAAERWASNACQKKNLNPTGANYRRMLGKALHLVRFPLMDDGQLADGPVFTRMLLQEEAFKIYQFKHASKKPDIPFSSIPRCPPNITFCGHRWIVVDGSHMSGERKRSADNVFLDEHGHLHVRLSQHNGVWKGAEIRSVDALGFGMYEFQITGRLDQLDPNIIFRMGSLALNQKTGIDITFAQWGDKSESQGCYGISSQDFPNVDSNHGFDFSLKSKCTTHLYTWEAAEVSFASQYGHQNNSPDDMFVEDEFESWSDDLTEVIPQKALPLAIYISSLGNAPTNGKDVEIIVQSFRFLAAE